MVAQIHCTHLNAARIVPPHSVERAQSNDVGRESHDRSTECATTFHSLCKHACGSHGMIEASVNHDHADIPHGDVYQLQVTDRPCDPSEASLN